MTAGGELRLLALGRTWEGINYITELSISELANVCEIPDRFFELLTLRLRSGQALRQA
jgi:hypothetical protein